MWRRPCSPAAVIPGSRWPRRREGKATQERSDNSEIPIVRNQRHAVFRTSGSNQNIVDQRTRSLAKSNSILPKQSREDTTTVLEHAHRRPEDASASLEHSEDAPIQRTRRCVSDGPGTQFLYDGAPRDGATRQRRMRNVSGAEPPAADSQSAHAALVTASFLDVFSRNAP